MKPPCPKCGENRLRIDDYGINCSCGWSPTVTVCGRCLCTTECEGHFYGGQEVKKSEIRMCSKCSTPVPVGE